MLVFFRVTLFIHFSSSIGRMEMDEQTPPVRTALQLEAQTLWIIEASQRTTGGQRFTMIQFLH